MELKTARLTILIDPGKKQAFETLCRDQDMTPSQVVRRLIREYMQDNGEAAAPAPRAAARKSPAAKSPARKAAPARAPAPRKAPVRRTR
jgi:hypothetical protein